jgi:hypothetical protein
LACAIEGKPYTLTSFEAGELAQDFCNEMVFLIAELGQSVELKNYFHSHEKNGSVRSLKNFVKVRSVLRIQTP